MEHAIPATEYSADERAERARGAGIAFLVLVAVIAIPLVAFVIVLLSR